MRACVQWGEGKFTEGRGGPAHVEQRAWPGQATAEKVGILLDKKHMCPSRARVGPALQVLRGSWRAGQQDGVWAGVGGSRGGGGASIYVSGREGGGQVRLTRRGTCGLGKVGRGGGE